MSEVDNDGWISVNRKNRKRKQKSRYNTLAECYSEECKDYLGKPHIMTFIKEEDSENIIIGCKYCKQLRSIKKSSIE